MPVSNPADPHTQTRATSQPCQLHKKHTPEPHVNHIHHIWPIGDGGPDISDNKIVVCPTGHYSVHDLLSHFKMFMGNVPYAILRTYSLEERKIAQLGFDRLTRKAM